MRGQAETWPMVLAEIAAEVLAKTPESLRAQASRDSFIGLGGSSLDAARLLALCERRLSRTLDLARLLGPAPLAEVLAEAAKCEVFTGSLGQPAAPEAEQAGGNRELLPGQRQLLLAEVYGGAGKALRILASAELTGPLDIAVLHQALRWAVARHETLRTVFIQRRKLQFSRRVLPDCEPQLTRQRQWITSAQSGVQAVNEQLSSAAERLVTPLGRPPIAFTLTEFGEHHHLLSVLVHHLVADAWAAGLLWREIFGQYQALLAGDVPVGAGQPAPSPDLLLRRHAALAASGRLAELTRARIAQLTGVPTVVELPTELPRPEQFDFRAARFAFGLSNAARDACDDVAGRAKVTRTVVIFAAWALVVARQTGMAECVIGGTALQRPTDDLMRTVVSCAVPVPVRCAFPDDVRTCDYLRATSGALAEAAAAADVPFDSLVEGLGAAADDRRVPLVQVMFSAYDGYVPRALQAGDLRVTFHEGFCGGTGIDAALFLQHWGTSPGLFIEYRTSVLTPGEAATLSESLDEALREFARHLDDPLSLVRAAPVRPRVPASDPAH